MQLDLLALTGWEITNPFALLAYIGPGVGAGAIAIILGIIGSIFLALFAVIWYPVKRLLKRKKTPQPAATTEASDPESTTDGNVK